jgi:hypothetical protein
MYGINENVSSCFMLIVLVKKLMMICHLDGYHSSSRTDTFSGHFLLSSASEHSLLVRSIASSELLLPKIKSSPSTIEHERQRVDPLLTSSLSQVNRYSLVNRLTNNRCTYFRCLSNTMNTIHCTTMLERVK